MDKYVIALYIRLSVEDSKTESYSIQNQLLALHKYADTLPEADNAEILEFIDNGHSGTNFERPAIQELLELVRGFKINCIIVKDFSRFGRNVIDTGYFIERVFPLFRTRFISISDSFDTMEHQSDTGGMEVAFKYLINEYYSKDLSEKSKSAKYMKMRAGEYQSKLCFFGYKKGKNNRLEIDDEAASVVRDIFNMSLQGKSAHQITEALYARSIPTPGEYKAKQGFKGYDTSRSLSMWQRSAVLRILYDERYIGTYIIGKRAVTEVGSHKVRLKDESEWFKIPDHNPAIIDKELFDQVQAGLKRNNKSTTRNYKQYPLRSKVFCGCCGHTMYRTKKDPEYACRYTRLDDSYGCRDLTIKERELERVLFEVMSKQAAVILNVDAGESLDDLSVKITERVSFENQIEECYNRKMAIYERFTQKEIDVDSYRAENAVYDVKLKELNKLHSALSAVTTQMAMDRDEKDSLKCLAKGVTSESRLTQKLADALIEKIIIFPDDQIEIVWKVQAFA